MIQYRKCTECKEDKPATEEFFYKDKNRYLCLMYRCKECDKKREKRYKPSNWKGLSRKEKDRKLELNRAYRKTPKGKALQAIKAYQAFDKKKGFDFNIDQDFFMEKVLKPCSYCGFPATGLDRIDNSKGHTRDNCIPCCRECNVARMDNFSHDEMLIVGKVIAEIKQHRISNQ